LLACPLLQPQVRRLTFVPKITYGINRRYHRSWHPPWQDTLCSEPWSRRCSMAGYITAMSTPLPPPHVLADLRKACRDDPLAASTIDKLISEITRVSEQIAAVTPACTDLAVAFNTQFLPVDHAPQQPSGRGVASSTPSPPPCLPRLARQTLDAHSDIFTSMPSKDCRAILDTDVMESTLFDTDASTISQETRSEDDGMSAINDNSCSEYDALSTLLRKQFGDLPTMTGDPDTSVLVDVGTSQDFAAQDPLPRCKLPCSYGDWNPDPWLNCQRACKRAVGHRGRHHCLARHPGFDHDQLLPHGSTGLLPPPPLCCCPNVCYTVTTHWFMLCDQCLHRTPMGVCPCVFSSHGECCRRWDLATDADTGITPTPPLPAHTDPLRTDWHQQVRPSKQAGTPYTGIMDGLSTTMIATQPGSITPDLSPDEIDDVEIDLPRAPEPKHENLPKSYYKQRERLRESIAKHQTVIKLLDPDLDSARIKEFEAMICRDKLAITSLPEPKRSLAEPPNTFGGVMHTQSARRLTCTYNELTSQGRCPDRLALQHARPSQPGCHVCNSEHTLLAEDDELDRCHHPDGCAQAELTDTFANACPRYPDRMICNPCYRPERAHDSWPDATSTSTLPSQSEWSFAGPPCETWTSARFIADDGILDGADTNHGTTMITNRGSVISTSDCIPKRRKEK